MGIKERWRGYAPLPSDILERIDGLTPFFRAKGISLAYLFGSLVKGSGNDLDIALLCDAAPAGIREELQEIIGTWRLDIVNLKGASPQVSFEIISTGKLIYKKDDETENSFEMGVIRRHQDRKPVRDRQLAYLKENLGIGA